MLISTLAKNPITIEYQLITQNFQANSMSNKLKIILAIITSVLIISSSAIIFNSQRRNNPISKTELSSSSSSSSTVSSSSSSQGSSVSVSSSSVESSLSSISVSSSVVAKIDIPITSQIAVSQTPMVEKPKAVVPQSQTITNQPTNTNCNSRYS